MFTYLKPGIRERLVSENKLFRIDADGNQLDAEVAGSSGQRIVNLLGPIPLPLARGEEHTTANWYATVRATELAEVENLASNLREQGGQHLFAHLASSMAVNSVLEIGPAATSKSPLVRVHSSCLTGDIFGSQRCECGPQYEAAVERISRDPEGGYLIYMAGHEGRGIGLWAKAATYLLQDAGENTYQANRSLGLPDDSRDFTDAGILLKYFIGDAGFRLLTNNPKKINDLAELGLTRVEAVKHVIGVSDWNKRYLNAKRDWGHKLSDEDIE